MHPDMGRFFGPALQEPTGAASPVGREQICVLAQATDDNRIYVDSENPEFRESRNWIAADAAVMYPGSDVTTSSDYELFGCEMTREILQARRQRAVRLGAFGRHDRRCGVPGRVWHGRDSRFAGPDGDPEGPRRRKPVDLVQPERALL